jgi:hypothetical protein
MNIKENFHIYHFNKLNKLIEEQKLNKEGNIRNDMFDILVNISTRPHIVKRGRRVGLTTLPPSLSRLSR